MSLLKFLAIVSYCIVLTNIPITAYAKKKSSLAHPSISPAMAGVVKDTKDALRRLEETRQTIASEKILLSREFETTRHKLIEKRRQVRIARMAKSDRLEWMQKLENKSYLAKQNFTFIDGQLKDYGLVLETFLLPGEEKQYRAAIEETHRNYTDKKPPKERLHKRLEVLDAGLSRLERLLGGTTIHGEAVASDGEVKSGNFLLAGPAIWFVSDDHSAAGAIIREKGSLTPRIRPDNREGIESVLAGGESPLSIDVTGGKALALATLESDPLDIFRKGGFWIWPIMGIAFISVIAGILKLIQIFRIRTPQNLWVSEILESVHDGDIERAKQLAKQITHPVSDVIHHCLDYVKVGPDVVEEVLYEQLIDVQNKMQSGLPFIAITAATAPLLGLLGTVAGMIRTFNVITVSGTGDAKPLAGGISEALITTLFGLIVAIPALIIHALLSRRCTGIVQTTEKLGLTLVNGLRRKSTK